jgi:sensor histidine kinase YesM
MKTKWIEISINILFWVVTAWFISSSFSIQAQELELVNDQEFVRIVRNETIFRKLIFCIALSFVAFYINLWNINTNYRRFNKTRVVVVAVLLLSSVLVLFYGLEASIFGADSISLPVAIGVGVFVFYVTVSSSYGVVKILIKAEQQQQQLLMAKKQAELNLLRNQLQPHFLFNALNNLLSLVEQQQSPQLANAFDKLSQLLRYVIEETKNERVPLEKEIEFIKNYATLQLLRFETDEVRFKFSIVGDFLDQQLEPGLLIPFVENAFKYGTEPENSSTIDLKIVLPKPNELYFSITNDLLSYNNTNDNTGTGIRAAKERLELVYPGKYSLKITKDEHYKVELILRTK